MGNAHRGDHDIAFYEARIGYTYSATLAADTPTFLNNDADGPLPPARYLIQAFNVSDTSVVVWVGFSPFEKPGSAVSIAGAGRARVPLNSNVVAIETNVLPKTDDRITLEAVGGTATVYATIVSSFIPKAIP